MRGAVEAAGIGIIVPTHTETLFITDAAINISPDLDAECDVIQDATDLFVVGGQARPRPLKLPMRARLDTGHMPP